MKPQSEVRIPQRTILRIGRSGKMGIAVQGEFAVVQEILEKGKKRYTTFILGQAKAR